MTDPQTAELAQIRAELAELRAGRVTHRAAVVLTVDSTTSTFTAELPDGQVLTPLSSPPRFLPAPGQTVTVRLEGSTPIYEPAAIAPVTDPVTGNSLSNTDDEGRHSATEGYFEKLFVAGQEFVPPSTEDDGPRGFIQYGGKYVDSVTTSTEVGVFEVAADLVLGRMYLFSTTNLCLMGPTGAKGKVRIRMTSNGSTPSITSTEMATVGGTVADDDDDGKPLLRVHTPTVTGTHRLLLTVARTGGTAGAVGINGSQAFPVQMWVEDKGTYRGNNAVDNDGGGGTTVVKQTLTKRYYATWSGTYDGNSLMPVFGNEMRQGIDKAGNYRSMVGFNSAQIMADLAGATIESCVGYFHANRWWRPAGGTALIGVHSNSARPPTWSSVNPVLWSQSNWPNPGGRRFDLGVGTGNDFKSGAAKGLSLGPAPNNSEIYFGRFNGAGMDYPPYIDIRFTK